MEKIINHYTSKVETATQLLGIKKTAVKLWTTTSSVLKCVVDITLTGK
jgi:hypothetical protein